MKSTSRSHGLWLAVAFTSLCTLVSAPAFAKKKKSEAAPAPAAQAEPEPAAAAEPEEENLEDLPKANKSCNKDIEAHCAKVAFGNNQIASCLRDKRDQVSDPCKKSLYEYLKKRFERACKSDVKKHCQKESTQQGGLMPCLQKHAEQLSDGCQEMMGLKKPAAPAPAAAPAK